MKRDEIEKISRMRLEEANSQRTLTMVGLATAVPAPFLPIHVHSPESSLEVEDRWMKDEDAPGTSLLL